MLGFHRCAGNYFPDERFLFSPVHVYFLISNLFIIIPAEITIYVGLLI